MIITSHMQKIIQIDPCLLKLSRKQDTILKIGDFSTTNYDFLPKPLLQIFPCNNPSKIMIITSPEVEIKNGQSRGTGIFGHTRLRSKINKTKEAQYSTEK
jgi:hypothetical protein